MNRESYVVGATEKLCDLQCGDMWLVQDMEDYCFTSDSVLLANFAKAKRGQKVLELCAGSGDRKSVV